VYAIAAVRALYRVVDAGAIGAIAAGVVAAVGGAGRKSGPFWPQPASIAVPATVATRQHRRSAVRKRPKIRSEKTIRGL